MSSATDIQTRDDTSHFFRDRLQLEQQIARLLGEFSRNHPAVSGLTFSLFRRVGNRKGAEEFAVNVHLCP